MRPWMRMRMVIALVMLLVAADAHADDKAKAAAHYKQGKAFFDAKEYAGAITEYEAAYAIDKLPGHLFNIARAHHLNGNFKAAVDYYQRFLDADPKHVNAAEARKLVVEATQQLAVQEAKQKADEDAKRKADEEQKKLAEQQKQHELEDHKRTAALAHIKQAQAFAASGAWVDAGTEYRAATVEDGDPTHLIDAAEAFRKQPDLAKARDALRDYLTAVPMGERSDAIRKTLAEITTELERADAVRAKADASKVAPPAPSAGPPIRIDLEVAKESPHGNADRDDDSFRSLIGVRLGVSAKIRRFLWGRLAGHLIPGDNNHSGALDASLEGEFRYPLTSYVHAYAGLGLLYGSIGIGMDPMHFKGSGAGVLARGGMALGKDKFGLALTATYFQFGDGSGGSGWLDVAGVLLFGFHI